MVTPVDSTSRPASPADVIDIAEAAARLGLPKAEAHSWLEEHNLVVWIARRERVVWGKVLEAMTPQGVPERPWSDGDMLSVRQAVKRMGMTDGVARAWLQSQRLVYTVGRAKRVVWGDVLRAARGDETRTGPADRKPVIRRPLPRSKLI